MKDLLKTNCFDTEETIAIVRSCLKQMSPKSYEKIEEITKNIYEVCLEETHFNMVVTKVIGILARNKTKKIVIATVDKSPHCVQLHYLVKELENAFDLEKFEIRNFVAVKDEIKEIPLEVIGLSKNLAKLTDIANQR